jgi:eukaryotic-like serine/threonine-protein kinase
LRRLDARPPAIPDAAPAGSAQRGPQSGVQCANVVPSGRRERRGGVENLAMRSSQARTARRTTSDTRRTPSAATAHSSATAGATEPILGRYRLQRRLGSGAFGAVWMASDERLERDVAVKILPRERIVGGRFEREARAAARLSHPGIVTLYEAAVDDEGAYLVSELVRGTTLDELLAGGHLSDRDIIAIGLALCDALEHAHAEGVVHRDVKPSNVLVPARPVTPEQIAKLTDFGVARVIGGDALTLTGDVVGTLAYMAPEQAEGLQAGAAADLYSLALVLYEALTGVNPVRTTTAAHRARRLGAHLPPLRRQRRDLPRELGQGIDMALRPRPRERGTIRDLRRALVAAREHVDDQPGVVEAPWTARHRETLRPEPVEEPIAEQADEPATNPPWQARGLAAVAAAATAAWMSSHVLGSTPLPGPLAALAAAALVLFLPRIGWLALAVSVSAIAVAQGNSSLALVTLLILALPVPLLMTRPLDWPLAAGATALGLIGLAGAWPALAARAASPWRRGVLGAIGWIWLLFAGLVGGSALYLSQIPGTTALESWSDSPTALLHHELLPVLRSGALTPALVWALAAVVLPWLVRGRSLAVDLVRVVIWAAMLESATVAATAAINGSDGVHAAPTAVIGSVAAAALALGAVWLSKLSQSWRPEPHSASSGGQFP